MKFTGHIHDRGTHPAILWQLPLTSTVQAGISYIYIKEYFIPGVIQEGAESQVSYLEKKERNIYK